MELQPKTPLKSVNAGALLPMYGCKRNTVSPGTPPTPDLTCPETRTTTGCDDALTGIDKVALAPITEKSFLRSIISNPPALSF